MLDLINKVLTATESGLQSTSDDELQKIVDRSFMPCPFNKNFDHEKFTAMVILEYRKRIRESCRSSSKGRAAA